MLKTKQPNPEYALEYKNLVLNIKKNKLLNVLTNKFFLL